jgi:hypothetical protein
MDIWRYQWQNACWRYLVKYNYQPSQVQTTILQSTITLRNIIFCSTSDLSIFWAKILQYLRRKILKADESIDNNVFTPSVLLIADCGATDFWNDIAAVADTIDAIGPDKSRLLDTDYANAHHVIEEARSLNLAVHPRTERLELEYVSNRFSDTEEELICLVLRNQGRWHIYRECRPSKTCCSCRM